jgi:ligand-binding SRPBCC domain-containing protein
MRVPDVSDAQDNPAMDSITITRRTALDARGEQVWDAVRSPQTFLEITRGALRMPVLEGRTWDWEEGEEVSGWIWLLGVLPFSRHTIRITSIDPAAKVIRTDERGGLVRTWQHDVVVEALDGGRCRYTDRVTIDAGWATLPVAAFAWGFYRYRQARWRGLVEGWGAGPTVVV